MSHENLWEGVVSYFFVFFLLFFCITVHSFSIYPVKVRFFSETPSMITPKFRVFALNTGMSRGSNVTDIKSQHTRPAFIESICPKFGLHHYDKTVIQ